MKKIDISIYTPLGLYTKTQANSLLVSTLDGLRGLQARHLAIVLPLKIGKLEIIHTNKRDLYAIGKGVLYFKKDHAKIMLESIENASDIDLERAMQAKERALKRLENKNGDLLRASIALQRAINRINIKNQHSK